MQKNSKILITLSVLASLLFLNSAYADIEWSGVYRFEGNLINNSDLNDKHKELAYGLSTLILRPKIVAGDGLTINGQFNILNNTAEPNSQLGAVMGGGVGTGTPTTSASNSSTLSQTMKNDTLSVAALYLTYNNEFGQLLVGRAPLQFGLGMTHNAGRGLFDHWYDTRDMVGYKFIVGNLYFFPMIGKANEGQLNANDDLTDYMIHVQYDNPENDLEMGVFYQIRKGADSSGDAPSGTGLLGGASGNNHGEVDTRTANIYALRDTERFRLGLEASFQSGNSGVLTTGNEKVTWGGFGVAGEFEYRPEDSKWKYGLKAGIASGDDPTTETKYEGFIFDRNYDVAMLMFNRPLGEYDALGTRILNGIDRSAGPINTVDTEAIANAIYLAPSFKYSLNDRWSVNNTFTTGWLNSGQIANKSVSKDLGYEYDLSVSFSPRKGVMWVNQAGLLFPGDAFKGDGRYDSSFAFGLTSKAAISF
jgi:hypothetical protein